MKKLKLDIQRFSSTNKTTHYELSQYVGTDKPTYLVDYNQDMSKIDAGIYGADSKATENATNIGTLSNLTTTEKSSIVGAINEVNSESSSVGDLTTLTTTDKTSVVGAINEVNGKANTIGDIANLTTTDKTSVVNSVNEVNAKANTIGNLSNLATTDKTSIVNAINENKTTIDNNKNATDNFETTITNYLTLSDNRNLSNPTTSSGTTAGNTMRVALNNTGSIGKIYGNINVNSASSNPVVKFTNTGIQTDTQFEINNCGFVRRGGDNLVEQANIRVIPANTSLGETSASIELFTDLSPNGNSLYFKFIPCLLFFSDFGDTN